MYEVSVTYLLLFESVNMDKAFNPSEGYEYPQSFFPKFSELEDSRIS
jgi:hypothetical protein